MEWMILPLKRYADFNGRSRRMEYWMFTLFSTIMVLIFGAIMLIGLPWAEMAAQSANAGAMTADKFGGAGAPATPEFNPGAMFWIGLGLLSLWILGTLIPGIAVTVRRFHDQDKSGWMYCLSFIPYIGGFIVLVFMFLDGTPGPNQYGEDPKARGGYTGDIFR